jgi:hypothetical protein
MTGNELENIFNDSDVNETQVEDNSMNEDTDTEEETVDGEGTETYQSNEEESTPSKDEKQESKSVPLAALEAERKKRQALEAELEKARSKKTGEEVEGEGELSVDEKLFNERVNISKMIMMETKQDYTEKITEFIKMTEESPALLEQWRNSLNPAKFAYEKATEKLEYDDFKSVKDSDEYKEFLEYRKSGKLSVKESKEEVRKKAALTLPKLNNATSKTGASKVQETLITRVEDMF